jgi:hypothetical protein
MRRFASAGFAMAVLTALVVIGAVLVEDSSAELENQVFTSSSGRLRMIVPRGWRATDQPSYPGLVLWMMKSQPPGQIVLTAERFTRDLYCSWPVQCRNLASNTAKYTCALREKLATQKLRVGPAQLGPKENEAAGIPSMYFEYDDGKRFLRQAVAVTDRRALSLVLSAPTNDARAAHTRPFDQALRTLQILTPAQVATIDAAAAIHDADPTALVDGAALDGGVNFESAPMAPQNPIGPCPSR